MILFFFFAFPLLLQRFNQKGKNLGHTGSNTHMQSLSSLIWQPNVGDSKNTHVIHRNIIYDLLNFHVSMLISQLSLKSI